MRICWLVRSRIAPPQWVIWSASGGNERLEFLGDRVLGLVVANLLYERFPKEREGALAKRFVALVRKEALAEVAEEIGLGPHIRLSKGRSGEWRAGEPGDPCRYFGSADRRTIFRWWVAGGRSLHYRLLGKAPR